MLGTACLQLLDLPTYLGPTYGLWRIACGCWPSLNVARDKACVTNQVLAVAHSNGAADVLLEALLSIGVPAVWAGGRSRNLQPAAAYDSSLTCGT